jgi:glycosyltransferase involved in cell wall biosynthesis
LEEFGVFSQAQTVRGYHIPDAIPDADIYNLHWINGFIDPLPFFENVQEPVVWTLHDMNPFTGGCHYNMGCRRFEDRCGRCPQLGSSQEKDLSRKVWKRKNRSYRKHAIKKSLEVVADSRWLADEARKSRLFRNVSVQTIHYGLDERTFRPRSTEGLRSGFEIPQDHCIVLFVAQSTENHRKGFGLLAEALGSLEQQDGVTLLSIGGEQPELETALPHLHLGTIESDLLLSVFYSFADLFVIPSRQEAFGQTAMEAMACGTAVVGFDAGGIPDMVRPNETGWLAEVGDVRSLRQTIDQALADENKRERMGRRGREVVENEFTLERQARDYKQLYRQIIETEAEGG